MNYIRHIYEQKFRPLQWPFIKHLSNGSYDEDNGRCRLCFFLLSYDRRADVAYRTNFTVWDFVFLILLSSTIWIWKKRSSDLFSFNSPIDLPSKTRVVTNKKTREKLKIKGETHEEDIKEVFCCCCLLCCAWGPFNFWHTTKKQQKKNTLRPNMTHWHTCHYWNPNRWYEQIMYCL